MIEGIRQQERIPLPSTLDIILINGRWAQVEFPQRYDPAGNISETTSVLWLDDKSFDHLDLSKYKLVQYPVMYVSAIKDKFTPEQINNIHWGSEQEQYPHLKLAVTVFGKYESK